MNIRRWKPAGARGALAPLWLAAGLLTGACAFAQQAATRPSPAPQARPSTIPKVGLPHLGASPQAPTSVAAPAQQAGGSTVWSPAYPAPAQAPRSPAEQQLQAIRDALIDKAMNAQTRVSATSWVNERGELMEASQFRTDMDVRGVRVLEYLGEPPQAVVSVSDSASPGPEPVCRENAFHQNWRHPISLQVGLHPSQAPGLLGSALMARSLVESLLREQAQRSGAAFRPAEREPAPSRSRYEQAVYGAQAPSHSLQLSVRTRLLDPQDPALPRSLLQRALQQARSWSGSAYEEEVGTVLMVEMSLARPGEAPVVQYEASLGLRVSNETRPAQRLAPGSTPMLASQVQRWWLALQDALACQPLVYEARRGAAGRFDLMAGEDAGLRPGDRLVLVDGRRVPRRLLEADAAPHLALLEVEQVVGDRARARQVAGPELTNDPTAAWVVMPLGTQSVATIGAHGAAR